MEFKNVILEDVAEVKSGKRLSKGRELQSIKNSHPYVRIRDMYKNKYLNIDKEIMYLPDDIYPLISKYIVNTDDVILANVGNTIGLVSKIGPTLNEANLTENCVKFVNLNGITSDFLYYYLISDVGQKEIEKGIVGSSQPKLPLYNIKKFSIDLPSIDNQNKISKILSDIDAKIELNIEINNNLHELGKELVSNCEKESDTTNVLIDVMEFINGFAFKSSDYDENGKYKIITIKNVQDGYIDSSKTDKIVSIPEKMKKECILNIGDILLSLTGNVGRVGIVYEENMLLNQRVAKFKPYKKELLPYLYFKFLNPAMREQLENISKGTAQQNLSPVETLKIKINYNYSMLKNIIPILDNIYNKIINNKIEEKKLVELRNTLLPKLMNGEIDLDSIEI